MFILQSKTIKAIASEGSCIFIGRAADEILKDDPDMISIFIHARKEDRIRRDC
jgi:cytidylate kinase